MTCLLNCLQFLLVIFPLMTFLEYVHYAHPRKLFLFAYSVSGQTNSTYAYSDTLNFLFAHTTLICIIYIHWIDY